MDKQRQLWVIALLGLLLSRQTLAGQQQSGELDKLHKKRGGNDFGPPLHLTSGVLQLLPPAHIGNLELSHELWPKEQEHSQVHVLPLYGSGDSNSIYSHDHAYWPYIYTLDNWTDKHSLLPTSIVVSDNLDIKHNLNDLKLALAQQQLQHYAKSYGR